MMMSSSVLSICATLLAGVILVQGEQVQFSKCQKFQRDKNGVARQYEQLCTINKVVVEPCAEAAANEPCKFKQGHEASISIDFTPQFSSSNVTSMAYWDQALVHVPFEDMDTNGCNHMKCPMEKDVPTSSNYKLNIKSSYPPDIYTVKWKLQDAADLSKECCFRVRIKIVP